MRRSRPSNRPSVSPKKPARLNSLGNSLCRHFEQLGDLGDLDEAMATQHQAIRLAPDGHRDKPPNLQVSIVPPKSV